MKPVNGIRAWRVERQMETRPRRGAVLAREQAQLVLALLQPVADAVLAGLDAPIAQCAQHRVVEDRGPGKISDAKRQMAEHRARHTLRQIFSISTESPGVEFEGR